MTSYLFASLGLLCLLILTAWLWQKRHKQEHRQLAMSAIQQLRELTSWIQKHRGMSAAFLRGNQQAMHSLQEYRANIQRLQNQLKLNPCVQQQERWIAYMDHWSRLARNADHLSVNNSFEQHTNLISNLLFLLEDVAEYQGFTKATFVQAPNIALLWRELPMFIEYIGQARAIGTAVTTAKISTQVDKVKLGFLHKKISQLSRVVFHHIRANGGQQAQQLSLIERANQQCEQLLDILHTQLLKLDIVSYPSDDYFALASDAMAACNALLEYEIGQLESILAAAS